MTKFQAKDGYTVEDMLHFGFGHVDAARVLFESDPAFYDSAGYLAHLGTEVVLKAWHLLRFGEFDDIHNLITLYDRLKRNDPPLSLGTEHERFLADLDQFYLLRYPRREKGPVEVGSDTLQQLDALLESLWRALPQELVDNYAKLNRMRKGGRVLMCKKVGPSSS